jgi:MoxR-like ATPase
MAEAPPELAFSGDRSRAYLATPETAEIVNIAIALSRPLLVEGEPGCGKTRLAHAIAEELNLGEPLEISVKSTSTAKELLYRVDALSRLQDAQTAGNRRARFIYPYVSLGPLGEAIYGRGGRRVVLLDEIDKADIDFPNDVLDVLEAYKFQIDELPPGEDAACRKAHGFGRRVSIEGRPKPILVITSNREKRLPEPFLRRCLYLRLEFPRTVDELRRIVAKNLGAPADSGDQRVLDAAVSAFHAIRDRALRADAQKPPGTSELIDWVKILHFKSSAPADIDAYLPPHWRLLFKTDPDRQGYEALAKQELQREPKAAQ